MMPKKPTAGVICSDFSDAKISFHHGFEKRSYPRKLGKNQRKMEFAGANSRARLE